LGPLCAASKHPCPISPANNQLFGDLICHHHQDWPSWRWQKMSPKPWSI